MKNISRLLLSASLILTSQAQNVLQPAGSLSNKTLGSIPHPPDFVSCSGVYGVELQVSGCAYALEQIFPSARGAVKYATFTDHKTDPFSGSYQVPLVFEDNPGESN